MFNHSALSHLVKIICCSVSLSHWSLPLCLNLTYSIAFMRQRWDCWIIMGMSTWRHYHILLTTEFPAYNHTLNSTTPTQCFLCAGPSGFWVAPCCKVPSSLILPRGGQAEHEHCAVRPLSVMRTQRQSPSACHSELSNRWDGTTEHYGFPSL